MLFKSLEEAGCVARGHAVRVDKIVKLEEVDYHILILMANWFAYTGEKVLKYFYNEKSQKNESKSKKMDNDKRITAFPIDFLIFFIFILWRNFRYDECELHTYNFLKMLL